jgi:ACT domain-containing protein
MNLEDKDNDNAIVAVVGSDKPGIIAKISSFFAENSVNIKDINQTILSGNFVMMMMVDIRKSSLPLAELKQKISDIGNSMDVSVSILHERVFTAMHRI